MESFDKEQILSLLKEWVKDKNEIEERIDEIIKNISSYLVAEDSRVAIGLIGYQPACKQVTDFVTDNIPTAEIISLYVNKKHQKQGIGKALIEAIEKETQRKGYKDIIIWSGPRYKETGWGFYNKLKDYKKVGFVNSIEFPVWKKEAR